MQAWQLPQLKSRGFFVACGLMLSPYTSILPMQPESQQQQPANINNAEVEIIGYQDNFLQTLVNLVNIGGVSFDITLVVGGFLISGVLITGDEYYETFGKDFGQAMTHINAEAAQNIREGFSSLGDRYKREREDKSSDSQSTYYIHLKNCKLGGVSSQSSFGGIWRGRISEVSGFFLGTFGPSK
jgi:hypothetical protein